MDSANYVEDFKSLLNRIEEIRLHRTRINHYKAKRIILQSKESKICIKENVEGESNTVGLDKPGISEEGDTQQEGNKQGINENESLRLNAITEDSEYIISPHIFLMMLSEANKPLSIDFLMMHPNYKVSFFEHLITHLNSLRIFDHKLLRYFSIELIQDINMSKFCRFSLSPIIWEYILSADDSNMVHLASELFGFFSKQNIQLQINEIIEKSFAIEAAHRLHYKKLDTLTKNVNLDLYSQNYNAIVHLIKSSPEDFQFKLLSFLGIQAPRLYDSSRRSVFTWICMQDKIGSLEKIEAIKNICTFISKDEIIDAFFLADNQGNHVLSAACELNNFEFFRALVNVIKCITRMKRHEIINEAYRIFKEEIQTNPRVIKTSNKNLKKLQNMKFYLPKNLLEVAITYSNKEIIDLIVKYKYNYQAEVRSELNYLRLILNAKKYYLLEYFLTPEYSNNSVMDSPTNLHLIVNKSIKPSDFLEKISIIHFEDKIFLNTFSRYFQYALNQSENFESLSDFLLEDYSSKSGLIRVIIQNDNPHVFTKLM